MTFSPEKQFPPPLLLSLPTCSLSTYPPPPRTSLAATSSSRRVTPTATLSPESHSLYQPHPSTNSPDTSPYPPLLPSLSSNKTPSQNVSPNFHLPSSQAGFAVDHPEEVVLPRRQGRRRRCCQASGRQARRQREWNERSEVGIGKKGEFELIFRVCLIFSILDGMAIICHPSVFLLYSFPLPALSLSSLVLLFSFLSPLIIPISPLSAFKTLAETLSPPEESSRSTLLVPRRPSTSEPTGPLRS